jgi:hypothetical protein
LSLSIEEMGNLERYLKTEISKEVRGLRRGIENAEEALRVLGRGGISKQADFEINIRSYWISEGEKSVTLEYRGSLKEAIRKAEKEFKVVNQRKTIEANYDVFIILGKRGACRYEIPQKYWEKFRGE